VVVLGEKLWEPSEERVRNSKVAAYMRALNAKHGLNLKTYDDLWRWSVADIEAFWLSVAEFCDVKFHTPPTAVLGKREMPGAEWFPGATLNFAEHMVRHAQPGTPALYTQSETQPLTALLWDDLLHDVRRIALALKALGVEKGDRVVCLLPAVREPVVCFLAAASIGAIWSMCSPDFGKKSVIDRFAQIEPKLLIVGDGYRYGGKLFDRRDEAREIIEALPTLQHVVWTPLLDRAADCPVANHVRYDDLLAAQTDTSSFRFEPMAFDHPLWVLYSSGTTGLPKAIVQSHGGITLELLKVNELHSDCRPGEVFFFYTSTGWMMWNFLLSFMLSGSVPVFYDGHPTYPDNDVLWKMASEAKATAFGGSPTYIQMMQAAGVVPKERYDFSNLRYVMCAGSPVTPEVMQWFYDSVGDDLWVTTQSGGTDICSGFVGPSPLLPVHAGEMQCRLLGVDVCAFDDDGEAVVGEVGELVCRQPMPSMPLYFWNDPDGERYRTSYFERWPGVWRHGDYLGGDRARDLPHLRPVGHDAQPLRCAHRRRGNLPHRREHGGGRRLPDREPGAAGRGLLHALVRQARRGRRTDRGPDRGDQGAPEGRDLPPARARRDLCGREHPLHPDRQEDRGSGQAHPQRHAGPESHQR
jgi:acetoacetyl-CoA synthetase